MAAAAEAAYLYTHKNIVITIIIITVVVSRVVIWDEWHGMKWREAENNKG